jgi:mRNA interferase HigB
MQSMTIRGRSALLKAMKKHAACRKPLLEWIEIVELASWGDLIEVRRTLQTADGIKGTSLTCFNIGGNNFRLLTVISYEMQVVSIHELLTHAEYNKKYVRRKP